MDLTEWLSDWPYVGRQHGNFVIVPDSTKPSESYRAMAWRLTDARVWKVSGGSIWFCERKDQTA